jgi:hypothetical protein
MYMQGRRRYVPKITEFAENVCPQFTLSDFRTHFRISKHMYDEISVTFFTTTLVGRSQYHHQKRCSSFCVIWPTWNHIEKLDYTLECVQYSMS